MSTVFGFYDFLLQTFSYKPWRLQEMSHTELEEIPSFVGVCLDPIVSSYGNPHFLVNERNKNVYEISTRDSF